MNCTPALRPLAEAVNALTTIVATMATGRRRLAAVAAVIARGGVPRCLPLSRLATAFARPPIEGSATRERSFGGQMATHPVDAPAWRSRRRADVQPRKWGGVRARP